MGRGRHRPARATSSSEGPLRALASFVLLAVASLGAGPAAAQTDTFQAERLRLAVDRKGIIDVEWARIDANPYEFDAALVLNYAYNPLLVNLRSAGGVRE